MQTSVANEADRGVRYAILAVLVVGFRRRDPGAVFNAVVSIAATYLPGAVERRYDVTFKPWQRAYLSTAMLTHSVGMLGPYDDVWWWDHVTHTHSATILGGVTFAAARRRGRDPRLWVVAIVACAGVLWEIAEYGIHATANRLGLEPVLVSYGAADTFFDLVFDIVGALVVVVVGDSLLGNLVSSDENPPSAPDSQP
ncbi:hypothetical protein CP556_18355 [Natrinema sp. CBA1119]|uniref:hypothetical protein n=1 Tax=Natrinema sp. CBA1119 TaxID=1608465 RepID=UPI000BF690A5|nr:hypothetical protein [Natrinema sp. CBA1119]PGF17871.1 hypothetical protein CP556_18355 [Natrinema sp. CBA1119]